MLIDFYTSDGVLYHHGVKGQEWGVKNGPPYPLTKGQQKKKYGQTYDKVRKHLDTDKEWDQETGKNFHQMRVKAAADLDKAYNDANSELSKVDKQMTSILNQIDDLRDSESNESKSKIQSLNKEYNKYADQADKIINNIYESYADEFKEAAIKDLGFKDTEAGKQMLEDYSDLGQTVDKLIENAKHSHGMNY